MSQLTARAIVETVVDIDPTTQRVTFRADHDDDRREDFSDDAPTLSLAIHMRRDAAEAIGPQGTVYELSLTKVADAPALDAPAPVDA